MKAAVTTMALYLFSISQLFSQGDTLFQTLIHDDSLRSYILYVPDAYDGSEEWPLVINLHGFAWDAASHMTFSNMNPVADTAHFIVAYPQGLTMVATIPGFPPPSPGFNLGADSLFVSPDDVDDVGFIGRLIDTVTTNYNIAPDSIYSTGFSNGGMFSHILACEEERIAAIAAVGSTLPVTWPCTTSRAVPVLQINGTEEGALDYEMGLPGLLHSVPETIEFWTTQNGCDAMPAITTLPDLTTADSSTVEYHQWFGCDAEVAHFKVFGGGHQWPGGINLLPFLGNLNLDINASAEIWEFFSRNSLTSTKTHLKPAEINLRAYPNPAATHLNFEFELPEAARVQLTLYNPLGQPIQVLANEQLPAGRQRINWQRPASAAAGWYYYRLQIGERFVAQPVVLR